MIYSIKLVFKIEVIEQNLINDITLFDEVVIVLLEADSFEEAYRNIKNYYKNKNQTYKNIYNQTVNWSFYDYFDCFLIENEALILNNKFVECYSCFYYENIDKSKDYIFKSFIERIMCQAKVEDLYKIRQA